MASYKSKETLIEGALTIYQRGNNPRPIFYMYAKLPNHKRVRKSLKTTHRNVAIKKAKDEYYKLLALDNAGLELGMTSFMDLLDMYQETKMYSETTQHRLKMLSWYFKRFDDVRDIKAASISEWVRWRKVLWTSEEGKKHYKRHSGRGGRYKFKNISERTLRMECIALKGLLVFAKDRGIISYIPDIITLTRKRQYKENKQHRRGAITQSQHQRILKKLNDDYRKLVKSQNTPSTMRTHARTAGRVYQELPIRKNRRLWCFVHLMNMSGLRVSECLRLKWRHIIKRHHYERDLPIIEINVDESISKTQVSRKVIIIDTSLIKVGESHLQKVLDTWRNITPLSDDEDWVFGNVVGNGRVKTGRVMKDADNKGANMDYYFSRFIKQKLNPPITTDKEGKELTATSYRHKWATTKITQGVPTALVAQLMGTSEIQIKNHYSHLLTWNVKDTIIDAVEKSVISREEVKRNAVVIELEKYL